MVVPAALIQSLQTVKGFHQADFEKVHASGEQIVSIRFNQAKPFNSNYLPISEKVKWCEHAAYLLERPFFTFDPLLHAGAYYVQEASSMFLWQALLQLMPETKAKKVLDLCAAPGGKSTLLSSYFTDGLLVSNEVIKNRAAILVENSTKWGDCNTVVTNNDATHFQSLPGFFDLIVVDAPCSGSGLFRKDPDAVTEWTEANVQLCSQRQQRILADILPALSENGILIYATCSYSQEEDELISDWLVNEMGMENCKLTLKEDWNIIETESPQHKAKGYRFFPNLVKGEGFFLACFRKVTQQDFQKIRPKQLQMTSKIQVQQLESVISLKEGLAFFDQNAMIRAIESNWITDLSILASHLYIKKAGIEVAGLKGKDIVPSHELALSGLLIGGFPVLDLDLENALQYLRRKEFSARGAIGWNLIRFGGLGLGWAKLLPNRVNNYYPAEWRILKD
ncbi:MAG: RNA methyltransferase [Chitinophagaceae bacterium]|nr:RNA methyltransferase [Chitinophagaceae bacterium]